jgi:hypothetical protein
MAWLTNRPDLRREPRPQMLTKHTAAGGEAPCTAHVTTHTRAQEQVHASEVEKKRKELPERVIAYSHIRAH